MAKLGELYKITSGGTPSRNHSEYYEDGTIPWVKTGDLKDKYLFETDEKISQLGLENSSARIYLKNTVLLAMYGATIGATSILKIDAATNQACAAFSPREDTLPEYLYAFLESQKDKFIKDAVGGAQPNLSAGYLKTIEFKLPSLEQQTRITRNLSKIDELLLLRKQQIAKLDELVKARFVEMFGNPKDNKKEWNRVPLKKVAEVRGRVGWKGYKKEDLQESGPLVLGATHLTENGNIDLSSPVYLSRDKYEESPEIMLHRNDLVFTQRGNTIGKVGLVKEDIGEATINPCVLILRPTSIHPIYLDVYFIMDEVKKDMWRLNAGSAQPMITQKGISEYLLMLPPIELQNQFAAFVERVDKQKQTVQQSLEKLELMKKALMQEYFG